MPVLPFSANKCKFISPEKLYALLAVLLLVFPSHLALNRPWQLAIQLGGVMYVVVGLVLIFLKGKSRVAKSSLAVLRLSSFLFLASLLSSIANNWLYPILVYGVFCLAILVSFILIGKLKDPVEFLRNLVFGVVISSALLILMSIVSQSITFNRYTGIFNNPNNMGWFTASTITLIVPTLFGGKLIFNDVQKLLISLVLGINFFMLFMCNSRAAFVSTISVVVLNLGIYAYNSISVYKISIKKKGFRKFIFAILATILLTLVTYRYGLLDNIIEKVLVTQDAGDISQGRLYGWRSELSRWTWLGHGPDYRQTVIDSIGHNTFISQMSRFGLISSSLFLLVFLSMLMQTFKILVVNQLQEIRENILILVPLSTIVGFLIHAAFETGATTPGAWLSILTFSAFIAGRRLKQY